MLTLFCQGNVHPDILHLSLLLVSQCLELGSRLWWVGGFICDGVKMLLCAIGNDSRGKVFFFLVSIEVDNNATLTLEVCCLLCCSFFLSYDKWAFFHFEVCKTNVG